MEKNCARNHRVSCHIHHCADLNCCRANKASLKPPIIIEQIKIRLAIPRNPDQLILPYFLRDRVSRGALPVCGDNFFARPLPRHLGKRLYAAQQRQHHLHRLVYAFRHQSPKQPRTRKQLDAPPCRIHAIAAGELDAEPVKRDKRRLGTDKLHRPNIFNQLRLHYGPQCQKALPLIRSLEAQARRSEKETQARRI
jgi:hypothetical protein